MNLSKIIATLCILMSCFSSPSASYQDTEHGHGVLPSPPALPRKIKVNEEAMVKGCETKDVIVVNPLKKQNEGLSGKSQNQAANQIHGNNGSLAGKGLDEGAESELFTMDYRHVRRRRPIHNKSVPSSSATP